MEAMSIGMEFLSEKKIKAGLSTRSDITNSKYELAYTAEKNGESCYYVFNNSGGGYVIVSADNRSKAQILGYSTDGHFEYRSLNPAAKFWMDSYADQISSLSSTSNLKINTERDSFGESIAPLLGDILWGQDEPYNLLCPQINGERCVTGCGATAMAQIMYYHKWPDKGQGKVSYISGNQLIEADLSESIYEWDKMVPIYEPNSSIDSQMAVALLMRDCGYAAEMRYGIYSSACDVHNGFCWVKNFNYDKGIRILPRDFFDDDEWEKILWIELSQSRPVVYEGGGDNGPHSFICDGYDQDGYFHFNFGWDGRENGYFLTSANLYPMGQYMICGIEKNHEGHHVLDFLSSSSFIYDENNNIFLLSNAAIGDVAEGGEEGIYNEIAMLGLEVENVNSGETTYFDGTRYPLFKTPISRKFEIQNAISNLKDGEYRVRPVCKIADDLDGWILCRFRGSCIQQFIPLTVVNGELSFNNELNNLPEGIVMVDGICYHINEKEMTASVTVIEDIRGSYGGHIVIPEYIIVDGKSYIVNTIGEGAFLGCGYMSVEIPATIKRIEKEAFKGIYLNSDIIFPEDSQLEYIDDYAFDCLHFWNEIVLPKRLKSIGKYAFRSIDGLKILSIPESVEEVGDNAFMWSNKLKELFVYWTEPIKINQSAFSDTDLSRINLNVPKGTSELYKIMYPWADFSIHDGNDWTEENALIENIHYLLRTPDMTAKVLLVGQSDNKSIVIPENVIHENQQYRVVEIEDYAAEGDKVDIAKVYIPGGVTSIGEYAFRNQSTLGEVEFGKDADLHFLRGSCFANCTNLKTIILPKTLEWIGAFTFYNCDNLNEIDLPASLSSIDQSAFENCPLLKDVTVHWLKPININSRAFAGNDYSQMRLHVPSGTKDMYKEKAPWSMFGQIIEDVEPVYEIPVESISLFPDQWNGDEGDSFKIKATVLPANASYKALVWSTSDDSVAIVNDEGAVFIHNEGNCIITASALDGSRIYDECIISCVSGVDSIFVNGDYFDIYNIEGRLIKKNSDREDIKRLKPGLYIMCKGNTSIKVIIR